MDGTRWSIRIRDRVRVGRDAGRSLISGDPYPDRPTVRGPEPWGLVHPRVTIGQWQLGLQHAIDAIDVDLQFALVPGLEAGRIRRPPESERSVREGRDFVTPGDVKAVAGPALSHRLLLKNSSQGAFARDEAAHLVGELLKKIPAPR